MFPRQAGPYSTKYVIARLLPQPRQSVSQYLPPGGRWPSASEDGRGMRVRILSDCIGQVFLQPIAIAPKPPLPKGGKLPKASGGIRPVTRFCHFDRAKRAEKSVPTKPPLPKGGKMPKGIRGDTILVIARSTQKVRRGNPFLTPMGDVIARLRQSVISGENGFPRAVDPRNDRKDVLGRRSRPPKNKSANPGQFCSISVPAYPT